jgi:hypothetical protein
LAINGYAGFDFFLGLVEGEIWSLKSKEVVSQQSETTSFVIQMQEQSVNISRENQSSNRLR